MIIQECRREIVRGFNSVNVACEVESDLFLRYYLGPSSSQSAALYSE